jgi:hypothetical protein
MPPEATAPESIPSKLDSLPTKIIDGVKNLFAGHSTELTDARATVGRQEEEIKKLKADLALAQKEAAEHKTRADKAEADFKAEQEKSKNVADQVKNEAGRKTAEQLAALHVAPIALKPDAAAGGGSNPDKPATTEAARERYQQLLKEDPKKAGEYYTKHKALLLS